jgi:hypothetical protein
MKKTLLASFSTLLLSTFLFVSPAQAVPFPITWGAAQTISGDSDVNTLGSLVYAYNVGPSGVASTTVNGVLFNPFAFPVDYMSNTVTVGSVTFTESPGLLVSYNTLGSSSAPFTNLTSEYKTLLSSGGSATDNTSITVTLGGLTLAQQYEIQLWTSNAANLGYLSSTTANSTNGVAVTLDSNTTDADGGVGQYAIGTFTATGATRVFTIYSLDSNPLINAFQVRAIPEPSTGTLAAMGLGLAVIVLQFRRKRS